MAEVDIESLYEYGRGDEPEVRVSVEPDVDYGSDFDSQAYSAFLLQVGFSPYHVRTTEVAFRLLSPLSQRQLAMGRNTGDVHTGSYNNGRDGTHRIQVFAVDAYREATHYHKPVNAVLNEVIAHETGHMYDQVIRGNADVDSWRRFNKRMAGVGNIFRCLSLAVLDKRTVESLLPLYADRPLLIGSLALGSFYGSGLLCEVAELLESRRYASCDKEKFANAFRDDYAVPDLFTSGRDG